MYLDSGSGSMIAQAVVAGAAGVAVVAKMSWKRMASPLRRKPAPPPDAELGDARGDVTEPQ